MGLDTARKGPLAGYQDYEGSLKIDSPNCYHGFSGHLISVPMADRTTQKMGNVGGDETSSSRTGCNGSGVVDLCGVGVDGD